MKIRNYKSDIEYIRDNISVVIRELAKLIYEIKYAIVSRYFYSLNNHESIRMYMNSQETCAGVRFHTRARY